MAEGLERYDENVITSEKKLCRIVCWSVVGKYTKKRPSRHILSSVPVV